LPGACARPWINQITPWCCAAEGVFHDPSLPKFREDKKLETVVIEKEAAVEVANAAPTCIVRINNRERVILSDGRLTKGQLSDYPETDALIILPCRVMTSAIVP